MSKVLIVDDSLAPRKMIAELLQSKKLEIMEAGNGAEALDKVKQHHPDLIVLDIVMPEMNGYEVCRNIKKDPATQDLVVLMCSCKGEEFDLYWGKKQGADDYIAKPFEPGEFLGKIQKLLKK